MLFDLRSSGRRRSIKAVYLTLAILMGGGLVFFGIGSDVQGGLLDAFREDAQTNNDIFEDRRKKAEARARAQPSNPRAWAEVARVRFQLAGQGENYDQTQGTFTDKGRAELRRAAAAWERYLALDPKPIDANLASLMVQALGPSGLNQMDKAVRALEIVVEARPKTAALYVQLATMAYAAGQQRKGDLAGDKALELASKDDREAIKGQLESAKSQGAQQAIQQATGQPAP